ncbi:MAG: metal-dependent hydrolase [Methanoregula sp.]|jgi:membrane-bound metal-dependent hydrolase YbcI (DUF457 family)
MITRHHVALALMCAFILCSPLWFTAPVLVSAILFGTLIGVLLPDIQMTRPKHAGIRIFAWLVARFSRRILTRGLCRVYSRFGYLKLDTSDKRLTHSIPGTAGIIVMVAVPLTLVGYLAGSPGLLNAILMFLGGVLLGLLLHLVEDLCTLKGISPFFPFSKSKIAGTIRPCNKSDPRITWFHGQHFLMAAIIFFIAIMHPLKPGLLFAVSVVAFLLCLGMMIHSSHPALPHPEKTPNVPGIPAPAGNS